MEYCEKEQAYKGGNNSSRLCLEQKLGILEHAEKNEFISKCRNIDRFFMCNLPPDWFHIYSSLFGYPYCYCPVEL